MVGGNIDDVTLCFDFLSIIYATWKNSMEEDIYVVDILHNLPVRKSTYGDIWNMNKGVW